MNIELDAKLMDVLSIVYESGANRDIILIGSWAAYLYDKAGVLNSFKAPGKTRDMDFLVKNLRRPNPPVSLSKAVADHGYRIDHGRSVSESDDPSITVIRSKDGRFSVEFLIQKVGAGRESSLKTNIGVTAQSLRHLDMLLRNTLTIDIAGIEIDVPTPEALATHKLIINNERAQQGQNKDTKDIKEIYAMWPCLDGFELERIADSLSRKEKRRFADAMGKAKLTMDEAIGEIRTQTHYLIENPCCIDSDYLTSQDACVPIEHSGVQTLDDSEFDL